MPDVNRLFADVGSDFHVDQWDTQSYAMRFPCGKRVHQPLNVSPNGTPRTDAPRLLIVAGDVSDDLHTSIKVLNTLSARYDHVLFVDGNHEHVHEYPNLYTTAYIERVFQTNGNPKLVYLPARTSFRVHRTAFVGACGWWDYGNAPAEHSPAYFHNWIPRLAKDPTAYRTFVNNVVTHAQQDAQRLQRAVNRLHADLGVDRVVVVTHCAPVPEWCASPATDGSTLLHSLLNTWQARMDNKVHTWVFGHTHKGFDTMRGGVRLLCHPRGRPDDYGRVAWRFARARL